LSPFKIKVALFWSVGIFTSRSR